MCKNFFVSHFRRGKWLDKSNSVLSDKSKVLSLLTVLTRYMKRGGLREIREDLKTFAAFTRDIVGGRYRDYSRTALTLVVAAILYVISPLDLLPDFIPLGFLDDVAIVTWAASRLSDEMERYKQHRQKQE